MYTGREKNAVAGLITNFGVCSIGGIDEVSGFLTFGIMLNDLT